ncbi:MAG TPA: glycosyltransferase family 2 protein [Candidatus Binataceae bacterium]|nr:glycosyltransferase family 2 protein [Candidatus Binataceae bacterium]
MKISTIILTYNAERTIGATIESALPVSDETFVVDSGSTDQTLAIVGRYPVCVVPHPFENYSAQRNWASDNLPLQGDWELHLDADERLSPALAQEIVSLKAAGDEPVDGYFIARLVHFLGRPIRHGGMYPIWHMRLFRHARGRCEARLYDQHFYVPGATRRLQNPMIDDQRNALSEWSLRHIRWADAEMNAMLNPQKTGISARLAGTPVERKRAFRGVFYRAPRFARSFALFVYRYVFLLGFLDGKPGLIFFVLQTFWFRFLIDAKLYERELAEREK